MHRRAVLAAALLLGTVLLLQAGGAAAQDSAACETDVRDVCTIQFCVKLGPGPGRVAASSLAQSLLAPKPPPKQLSSLLRTRLLSSTVAAAVLRFYLNFQLCGAGRP